MSVSRNFSLVAGEEEENDDNYNDEDEQSDHSPHEQEIPDLKRKVSKRPRDIEDNSPNGYN